ncbi:MAG: phosphopantetheine-binding protein [Nitrospiraceae bacterium]|nr:phosphopantetheine-binding protein [Nitrospiraceae bacterium]
MLQALEKFVVTEIAADLGRRTLAPDEDLLEQRIIDSLGILRLVTYLEESQGVKILDGDIVPENFQTLNSIIAFIERKKQNA